MSHPTRVHPARARILGLTYPPTHTHTAYENSASLYDEYKASILANPLSPHLPSDAVVRKLRGECGRYLRAKAKYFREADSPEHLKERIEALLTIFLLRNAVGGVEEGGGLTASFHVAEGRGLSLPLPSLVPHLGPFLYCMLPGGMEHDIYFSFERHMRHLHDYLGQQGGIPVLLGHFTRLFRTHLPELHGLLEEEEVSLSAWAVPWLVHLLSRELPFECLLRLWDTYFSGEEAGLDLHVYVCVAVLLQCQGHLEELEHADIISNLCKLPVLDMERVIGEAYRIRQEEEASTMADSTLGTMGTMDVSSSI
jgi:hypothetical protein